MAHGPCNVYCYEHTSSQGKTSWDELSSHQAEAVSLNLASRYGYITTVNHGEGAIKAQVGFNLCFDAIQAIGKILILIICTNNFWAPEGEGCTNL